jgi:hypothetical protein
MMMTMTTLPPKLQVIADKVTALQRMKNEAGFETKKTIRELLSPLTPAELTLVAEAVYTK